MIQGYFDTRLPAPVPMVRAAVFLPSITPEWVSVDFVLDTGASATCLHPLDAVFRAGIPVVHLLNPQFWPNQDTRQGVGGGALYFPWPTTYAFLQDDGQWKEIEDTILIAQLTVRNTGLASLLGWNILDKFHLSVDWARRTIELA